MEQLILYFRANAGIASASCGIAIATIDERASLRQAALYIEKHRIGCLPVVTDGKLRGIITDTDFVAVAINLLELLEETEPSIDDYEDVDVA